MHADFLCFCPSYMHTRDKIPCCCAEATLARRWPRRLRLKSSMKDIQEHVLRLHLPYPKDNSAAGTGACQEAQGAPGHRHGASDQAETVSGIKRPLPFDSRAALLQSPLCRPRVSC